VFGAKGATLYQPGATPQEDAKSQECGLKARHTVQINYRVANDIDRAFSTPTS